MNRANVVVRFMIVALLLLMAGCFRPAGESIEPTTGVVLPPESPTFPATLVPPTDTLSDVLETEPPPSTATLPPSTPITPANVITQEAGATIDQDIIQSLGTDEITAFPTLVPATSTPRFITPGRPLGPVTPDTATPTLDAPPTSTPSGLITPTALPGTEDGDCTYIVQPGDNLYRIATSREFTVEDMLEANPDLVGDPPILQVGQTLQLPRCEPGTAPISVQTIPVLMTASPIAPVGGEVYIVQPGDTLYGISQRFGIPVQAIVDTNNLANPDRLDVGQQLIIPRSNP